MAVIKPFCALRPAVRLTEAIAALPYDVYSSEEAREAVKDDSLSFLRIDRPETQFPVGQDMYAEEVYDKAASMLDTMIEKGEFVADVTPCFYLYEQTMDGRSQTGLAACSAVDDYLSDVIRKHENTRKEKEMDRIRHVDRCNAQTGPIFLAYRDKGAIDLIIEKVKNTTEPYADFTKQDGIRHRLWRLSDEELIQQITQAFSEIDHTYIADGHHRAASAVRVSLMRREANPEYTGTEEYNYFLSVLFPAGQLKIMDYNRVLMTKNGKTTEQILKEISEKADIVCKGTEPFRPSKKGEIGFLIDGIWYALEEKEEYISDDPVETLDVSFLQREIIEPVFGISDPTTDKNIGFVGGIRGLSELERRCQNDCCAAFAMYPTDIHELFRVADEGLLMPPKSTWFEPKLLSGLFIHKI